MLLRRPWLIVALGVCGIAGVLLAAGAAYWQYANTVPDYLHPAVVMPVPNAYDDYLQAGILCQDAGAASVTPPPANRAASLPPGAPAGPPGTPGLPSIPMAVSTQAYDDGVPLAQVRAVVARNRAALVRLRQGFGKQFRNPPATSPTQTFPELSGYRELARVLITEAKLAEREGRIADAAHSFLDCLRLGADVPRGGDLIQGLTGIAIEAIGLNAMSKAVDQMDAPTALATAQALLRLEQQAPGAGDVLQAEKERGTENLVRTFRAGIDWRQFSPPGGAQGAVEAVQGFFYLIKFGFTPKKRMLDDYRTYMDAIIANARKPYYAASPLPPPPNDPLSRILLPVYTPARWRWTQRDAIWRILELRLATRAYTARHGAPPSTADVLVPEYLPAVPRDPCANQPLVYRVRDSRVLIYSRGPDGDDDGGIDLGMTAQPGSNGDIVNLGGRRGRSQAP